MSLLTNLEAFYSLNGNAQDSSGNGRHGTPTLLTYADGGALFAAGSLVDIPALNLQVADLSYSLSFMFKTTAPSLNAECVIADKASPYAGVYITTGGVPNEGVIFERESWGPSPSAPAGATGTWKTAVWTYSTTSGYAWYVNAALVASGTGSGLLATNLDRIGLRSGRQRIGLLKNIGCWSRELSGAEVAELEALGGDPTVPAPSVSSVTPSTGLTAGGTAITIAGANFVDGAAVTIGGVAATSVVFVDDTEITCVVPAGAAGGADVVVTNPDTQSGTLADGFTYAAPDIFPAHDVATLLAGTISLPNPPGGSDVTLTYAAGGNLLRGPVRPFKEGEVPQRCVFVMQSAGQQPLPYMGQSESWHVTRVQVSVRSELHAFAEGEALARALHARAHLNTPSGYTFCLAAESDPTYVGAEDDGAHRFVFNLDLGHRR